MSRLQACDDDPIRIRGEVLARESSGLLNIADAGDSFAQVQLTSISLDRALRILEADEQIAEGLVVTVASSFAPDLAYHLFGRELFSLVEAIRDCAHSWC